jgi:hypothetical protein
VKSPLKNLPLPKNNTYNMKFTILPLNDRLNTIIKQAKSMVKSISFDEIQKHGNDFIKNITNKLNDSLQDQIEMLNMKLADQEDASRVLQDINANLTLRNVELFAHLLRNPSDEPSCCGKCTKVKSQTFEELCQELFNNHKEKDPCVVSQHQDLEGVLSDMQIPQEKHTAKDFNRHFDKRLTPTEQEAIDNEFDKLFGEHVCTRPKAKSKNELNQLYEELFDR